MEPATTDRREFEALVVRYQDAVCAMAYAVLRDRARSEEIAQEAFLVAWQRSRTTPVTPAWICGVARNLARNAARRRTEVTMVEEPIAPAADARAALIGHEDAQRAAAALAALPARYRDAVVLYYRGDESMAAVAEALGISRETAKQRVHRGRAQLRELATVEASLRTTRPGPAFTAAVVGVWLARGGTAHAGPAGAARWTSPALPLVGAGVAAVALAAGIAVVAMRAPASRPSIPAVTAPLSPASVAARLPTHLPARFPAARGQRPPRRPAIVAIEPVEPPAGGIAAKTVDLDFAGAPAQALIPLLGAVMEAPILIDPAVDAAVNVQVRHERAIDVLDEILAQAGAERTEVAAIRLVATGGRVDAAELGGDPVSLHLRDAPADDVLQLIAAKLQMPIGRLAAWDDESPVPPPHVTIDVDEVPAGVALEQLLVQTGLGYELTTGFLVTPDDPDGT